MPMWNHTGHKRPDFAIDPGPGQESVWDYPRPPIAKRDARTVEVRHGDAIICTTNRSFRIMETASPPTFYIPPENIDANLLIAAQGSSVCEWKGAAQYWALAAEPNLPVGWSYPRPRARFDMIKDHFSFYPGRIECLVDGERVRPQPGRFYGGWITNDVVGPFKGEPGSGHW